jgi:UDP-GlcNAc:undecaprenyl-phosphate GlcNAc-1-phosphate transferase
MPFEARLLTGLGLSLLLVFRLTPVAIRAAGRFDFYDRPVGYKGHAAPTPYLGGAAVVAGFAIPLLLLAGNWSRTLPLVIGVAALWVVGTIDDRRTVTPLARIALEASLAVFIFSMGQGWDLGSAPLSLAVTVVWTVAVINAFNLFDNMDGATSSMAAVVCAAVTVLGVVLEDRWLAVAAIALTGACAGFLPHNLAPRGARIFLGDGGSMPIGFAIAVLVMSGTSSAAVQWQALAMGLMLVGVPALDTALVVVSRMRRGIPLLTGGRDHLTHRTGRILQNARGVAVALGSVQVVISALAIVALEGGSRAIVGAVSVYLLAIGVAIAVLDTWLAPEPKAHVSAVSATTPDTRRAARGAYGTRILAVALGLGLGLSPLFYAYYSAAIWVPNRARPRRNGGGGKHRRAAPPGSTCGASPRRTLRTRPLGVVVDPMGAVDRAGCQRGQPLPGLHRLLRARSHQRADPGGRSVAPRHRGGLRSGHRALDRGSHGGG